MRRLLIALAVTAIALPALAADAGMQTFKDWLVICDNTDVCEAIAPADVAGGGYLKIARHPGADGEIIVEIARWPEGDLADSPWALTLDRQPVTGFAVGRAEYTDHYILRFEGEAALAFARSLANGTDLTLGGKGLDLATYTLSGSSAALRYIDDAQNRSGTVDAFVARGDKRPSTAVAPIPKVRAAPAASQANLPKEPAALRRLANEAECDTSGPGGEEGQFPEPIVARLKPGLILWGAFCTAGAYNYSYLFFTSDEQGRGFKPVSLPHAPGAPENGDDPYIVNPAYDPKDRTLQAFSKGRGIGDCGVISTWVWTGAEFALVEERWMNECWGMFSGDWPILYRAELIP